MIDFDKLKNNKIACLTLDVEQDYGDLLDEPSYEGLSYIDTVVNLLRKRDIPLTCFVQGSLLETHPTEIERLLTLNVEFELHSYSHSGPRKMNIKFEIEKGREVYRKFFGKYPVGYRSPLGIINEKDYEILASNGFRFDSSILPSIRPGVFNNLRLPTKPYFLNNFKMVEFPFTVFSSIIRIPIALSYIKLLGKPYLYILKTFNLPNFIVFGFHLHDLFNLDSVNKLLFREFSPMYKLIFNKIYRKKKNDSLALLNKLITIFHQRGYAFSKLKNIYDYIIEVK